MRIPKRFFEPQYGEPLQLKKTAKKDTKKPTPSEADSHWETKDFIVFNDDSSAEETTVAPKDLPHEKFNIEGLPLRFPFKPYPCQIQLMSKVIRALKAKEHGLLESPTGTGKTMSLLCSVLSWLESFKSAYKLRQTPKQSPDELVIHECTKDNGTGKKLDDKEGKEEIDEMMIPKIYFASRTHKQLSQVVKELRRSTYSPKFCVLASRSHYCINSRVRAAKDINEACFEAITSEVNHCRYINKVEKFVQREGEAMMSKSLEELVHFGEDNDLCPYFLSREGAEQAELIFCPFDYIVNQTIRSAMNINLNGAVVIFDEAHNIEDVCRDAGGVEVTGGQLLAIQSELNQYLGMSGEPLPNLECPSEHMNQLALVSTLHNWLINSPWKSTTQREFEKDVDIWIGEEIKKTLKQIDITKDKVMMWMSQLTRIDERRKIIKDSLNDRLEDNNTSKSLIMSQGSQRVLASLYGTLLFAFGQNEENLASYRLVRQREFKVGEQGKHAVYTLGLWCLNPAVVFKDITSQARSVILTSGTLSPMETFSSELGTGFENRLEALHVIDPEQVWVGALGVGPQGVELKGTFKELETFAFQDDIAASVLDICTVVPDGVLCFVPSYSFMDKLMRRMEGTGAMAKLKKLKKVFSEPKQGGSADFEKLIRSYYASIGSGRGAIFFAVFRGKVSEGLDFADENARAVISIGIPFPALRDEKVVQKRMYNDIHCRERNLLNGNLWYDKQAYRALNQALGRCIRHRNDWGAIILLERRFHNDTNINGLSKWIRPRVKKFANYQESMQSLTDYITLMQSKSDSKPKTEAKVKKGEPDDITVLTW